MWLKTWLKRFHKPDWYLPERLLFQVLIFIGGSLAALIVAPLAARFSPALAVLLAWLWFTLPGFILSRVFFKQLSWVEHIPVGFVLSLGVTTPFTVLAILLRARLEVYLGLLIFAQALALVVFLLDGIRHGPREAPEGALAASHPKRDPWLLIYVLILVLAVGGMAYAALQWPIAGDDLAGLPYFSEVLQVGQITGTEPFHGTGSLVTPRNELIVWGYQNILVIKVAGTSAVDAMQASRPILVVLSCLAFFVFLRRFFKEDHLALFVLVFWNLYLLVTIQKDGMGNNLITRIIQDKFVGWFIVVPVILAMMLWVLENGRFREVCALAIGSLGATLLHPITLSTILLLASSFGLVHVLCERSKKSLIRTMLVGGVLALCLLIPIYQYVRYTDTMPLDLAGMKDSVEYGRLSMAVGRYRLWLLEGGQYILHPSIVLTPVVLAGYALTPFLVFQLRKSHVARLLLGWGIFLPAFLYIPPLATLVGKFVTPYLLWRLAWPIPAAAVMLIGWVVWALAKWLVNRVRMPRAGVLPAIHHLLTYTLIVAAVWAVWPGIQAGYKSFLERYQEESFGTCVRAQEALAYLDQLTQDRPVNVLASRSLNTCIPGYAAFANVIEFRGYGTVNRLGEALIQDSLQRAVDARYFSITRQVDDLVVAMIERWDIDYVFVEAERLEINLQMRQMESLFAPVYSQGDFAIYAVVRPIPNLAVVDGYTAIRQRDWGEAEAIFTGMIQADPEQILAYLGLGMVREAQGDLEQSLQAYLLAAQYGDDEPAIHYQIAGTYLLLQDTDNAIRSYRQAASLAPGTSALYTTLGLAYHIAGEDDAARSSYEAAAALRSVVGTASYYALMGDLMSAANWQDEAVENYRRAIELSPSSLLYYKLAQSLAKLGDWQGAIQADQQAIGLDPWDSAPHVHLGSIYRSQGQNVSAIQEFEQAWRLNPMNSLAATSLANTIRQESGTEVALARMQELLSLSRLLPGPRWGMVNLYRSQGNYPAAVEQLNLLLTIQVDDPSAISTLGDIAREDERFDEAEAYYDQALLINPDFPTARSGISNLYGRTTEYGPQLGQYLWLERTYPSASWPHYLVAPLYTRLGNLEAALAEVRWALLLEPRNASGYLQLGSMYGSRGRYQQAAEQYQKAISLQPDLLDAYLNLALAYTYLGQPQQARATLEMALEQVLEVVAVRTALGNLAILVGDYEAARIQYEAAIALETGSPDPYVGLSRLYLVMGNLEAAMATLQAATQSIPEDFTAYDLLADLELFRGNSEAAMQWLQSGVQANPASPLGYVNIGDEYRRLGMMEQAVTAYQQALAVDDQNVPAYFKLAALYENFGDYATAEMIYQTQIVRVPYANSGYLNLGRLYVKMGQWDDAEAIFRQGLSVPPVSSSLYLAISDLYIARTDWDAAVDTLEMGYRELPTSSETALNLANIYRQVGDVASAQRVYEKALDVQRAVPGIYLGLAQLAQLQGDVETARQWLEQALLANPRSVEACLNLAYFSEAQGANEDAERLFRQALELDPLNNDVFLALGQFYIRQERFEDALQVLQSALQIPPNKTVLYINIGNTYLAMGRSLEAEQWYQAAIALDRLDVAPHLALAALYQSQARWAQALESLQSALLLQPDNGFVHMALGGLYRKIGNYDAAAAEFQRVCALEPLRTDCHISLGDLYAVTGQVEAAAAQYQAATRLAPTEPGAYLALARMVSAAGQASQAAFTYAEATAANSYQPTAWLAQAAYYASQRDWAQAQVAYESAWQHFPDNQEVGRQLALYYRQRGNWPAATGVLDDLTSLAEVEASTYVAVGDLYAARAQWQPAAAAYQNAIQQDAALLAAYTGLANIALLQGQVDEVVRTYLAAATAMPEDPQAYLALGDAYLARLDLAAAQAAYERAQAVSTNFNSSAFIKLDNLSFKMSAQGLDLAPLEEYARSVPTASVYTTLAYRYQLRGEWQTAQQWYEAAVALEPTNSAAWLSLGTFYRTRQDLQAALTALEKAVQYAPASTSAWLALGGVQEALNLPEGALASYQIALELDRSAISAYLAMANWYATQGQNDAAVDYLLQGVEAAPGSASGYEALGRLYLSWGQIDTAMEIYQAGLVVIPGAVSLYLGQAGYMGDQLSEAQESVFLAESLQNYAQAQLERTIGNAPAGTIEERWEELEEAEVLLAQAQAEYDLVLATHATLAQDFETAAGFYQQVLRIQPDNVSALVGLGDLYRDFNRSEEALAYYEQAVAANPTSVTALNALGYAYLAMERVDDSLEAFALAAAYSPNNLGVFYGMLQAYGAMDELHVSSAAYSIRYSQYWWVYFVEHFRESGQ